MAMRSAERWQANNHFAKPEDNFTWMGTRPEGISFAGFAAEKQGYERHARETYRVTFNGVGIVPRLWIERRASRERRRRSFSRVGADGSCGSECRIR